jgi:hypothetical protein
VSRYLVRSLGYWAPGLRQVAVANLRHPGPQLSTLGDKQPGGGRSRSSGAVLLGCSQSLAAPAGASPLPLCSQNRTAAGGFRRIPHPDLVVLVDDRQQPPVWAERHTEASAVVAGLGVPVLGSGRVRPLEAVLAGRHRYTPCSPTAASAIYCEIRKRLRMMAAW